MIVKWRVFNNIGFMMDRSHFIPLVENLTFFSPFNIGRDSKTNSGTYNFFGNSISFETHLATLIFWKIYLPWKCNFLEFIISQEFFLSRQFNFIKNLFPRILFSSLHMIFNSIRNYVRNLTSWKICFLQKFRFLGFVISWTKKS